MRPGKVDGRLLAHRSTICTFRASWRAVQPPHSQIHVDTTSFAALIPDRVAGIIVYWDGSFTNVSREVATCTGFLAAAAVC